MNDTRMALTVALTATQEGAAVANRVKVVRLLKDATTGRVCGARLRDELSSSSSSSSSEPREWDVYAKAVVNATGCFADAVRCMDNPAAQPLITPAAGVHVILPDHFSPSKMGLIVPKTRDGRVLFFFRGRAPPLLAQLTLRVSSLWRRGPRSRRLTLSYRSQTGS